MKALMYHYVRYPNVNLPHFTYLHRDDFAAQIRNLKGEFGIVDKERFLEWMSTPGEVPAPDGVIITFDDGLADHHREVAPILAEEGIWGIFYVPTGIFEKNKILDVHRIHLLLGRLGGNACASLLGRQSVASMFPDEIRAEFTTATYQRQASSDEMTKHFKRMLNYFVDFEWRAKLLDRLIVESGISDELWQDFSSELYMSTEMVADLHRDGHIVGSHSVTHRLMSKLSLSEQRDEIVSSLKTLSTLTGTPVTTFCHPYGGFHSFTSQTESILNKAGVLYSFNVEQRDIAARDVLTRPQALPRYDCNQFSHGRPSIGDRRP